MSYSKPLAAPTLIIKDRGKITKKKAKKLPKSKKVPRMSKSNFNQFF